MENRSNKQSLARSLSGAGGAAKPRHRGDQNRHGRRGRQRRSSELNAAPRAAMSQGTTWPWPRSQRPPRPRGDEPANRMAGRRPDAVRPALAGMNQGASIRPANSSSRPRRHGDGDNGRMQYPRTRGDIPDAILRCTVRGQLPRGSGDEPSVNTGKCSPCTTTPHTRGYTRRHRARRPAVIVCPAIVGMNPGRRAASAANSRLPRKRGDAPWSAGNGPRSTHASPPRRG